MNLFGLMQTETGPLLGARPNNASRCAPSIQPSLFLLDPLSHVNSSE